MDEYIEKLIAEFDGPPALRAVVRNILDETKPEATKRRLLKPLLSRPIPPVRKRRGAKRKALLAEFDPLLSKKATGGPPSILLHKEFANRFPRNYRTMVPHSHRLEGDLLVFLSAMESSTEALINEELIRHDGIKYTTILTVEFEKLGPKIGNTIATTAYFNNNPAETIFNAGETQEAVQAAESKILQRLEGFTR